MKEVSNKVLVGLLVVAVAVSVIGTFVSLDKLSKMNIPLQTISGGVTQGTANLYIQSATEITLYNDTMSFGTGYTNSSGSGVQYCNIRTSLASNVAGNTFTGDNGANTTPCINFDIPASFVIENTGTSDVNVSMNSSHGATWEPTQSLSNSNGIYKFKVLQEGSACGLYHTTDFTNMSTIDPVICGNLSSDSSNDAIGIQINISVPEDPQYVDQQEIDTIDFTATTI